ncbi:unnamed protein product, partial [marine sediment metagenome]
LATIVSEAVTFSDWVRLAWDSLRSPLCCSY